MEELIVGGETVLILVLKTTVGRELDLCGLG
jgi:hypothetical protein